MKNTKLHSRDTNGGRKMKRKIISPVIFFAIGIVLFFVVQTILTPEDTWPHHKEKTANMLAEIGDLQESNIQCFFIGTSHVMFSVDPMRIYKNTGIVTYNLASSAQRIDAGYYVLKDALQSQSPKYVFLDASNLFNNDEGEGFIGVPNTSYRYILDSAAFGGESKIELAKAYSEHFPEEKRLGAFIGALFPIYQYHERWENLENTDFSLIPQDLDYFLKGYYMTSVSLTASVSVSYMNDIAQQNATLNAWRNEFNDGAANEVSSGTKLYDPKISEENLQWLRKYKELCEEKGATLCLMKIPSCAAPQTYSAAWTTIKSDIVKGVASDLEIQFLDLLYDVDLGINWTTDTQDVGRHMNYLGSHRVTDYLTSYLQNECGLQGTRDENYERDLSPYDSLSKVAELQMTQTLSSYLEKLSAFDDVTVFFTASDMTLHLSQENGLDLNEFGLMTAFNSSTYIDSFVAIKEGGEVCYEASSNRRISHSGELKNGSSYTVTGCGWGKGMESKIIIDGVNYARNAQGINIVVYDNASKLVIDSVTFPTYKSGNQNAVRDLQFKYDYSPLGAFDGEKYLLNYELYLMEKNAKND